MMPIQQMTYCRRLRVNNVQDCTCSYQLLIYLRGGSPAKPSSVRLYFLWCPDSFLLCLFFIFIFSCLFLSVSFYDFVLFFFVFHSEYISLSHFSAYVGHVTTAGSLGDQLKCDNQIKIKIKGERDMLEGEMRNVKDGMKLFDELDSTVASNWWPH